MSTLRHPGGTLRLPSAGEVRRNLDGTEAGAPDEAQRRFATEIMEQRAANKHPRLPREHSIVRSLAGTRKPCRPQHPGLRGKAAHSRRSRHLAFQDL